MTFPLITSLRQGSGWQARISADWMLQNPRKDPWSNWIAGSKPTLFSPFPPVKSSKGSARQASPAAAAAPVRAGLALGMAGGISAAVARPAGRAALVAAGFAFLLAADAEALPPAAERPAGAR